MSSNRFFFLYIFIVGGKWRERQKDQVKGKWLYGGGGFWREPPGYASEDLKKIKVKTNPDTSFSSWGHRETVADRPSEMLATVGSPDNRPWEFILTIPAGKRLPSSL